MRFFTYIVSCLLVLAALVFMPMFVVNLGNLHLAQFQLGDTYFSLVKAEDYFHGSASWDANNSLTARGLASIAAIQGEEIDVSVADPGIAVLFLSRARRYMREGQVETAIPYYKAAIKIEPSLLWVYFDLASIYSIRQEWAEFASVVSQLESHGVWTSSGFVLRDGYLATGPYTGVHPMRTQKSQYSMWSTYWTTVLARRQSEWEKVSKGFLSLLGMDSTFPSAALGVGEAKYFLGRCSEAINYLETAAAQAPELYWPLFYLAECYSEVGDSDKEGLARSAMVGKDPCLLPEWVAWGSNVYWFPPSSYEAIGQLASICKFPKGGVIVPDWAKQEQ